MSERIEKSSSRPGTAKHRDEGFGSACTDGFCGQAFERLRALDEERVAMVMRREKPVIIRAVCEAYQKALMECQKQNMTRRITHENQAG